MAFAIPKEKLQTSNTVNALKFYSPNISYIDLHTIHNRAFPSKFCLYRPSLLLHKAFRNEIPQKDCIDLNFQLIITQRQMFFEIRNQARFKVGNNILSNRLTGLIKNIILSYYTIYYLKYVI